MAAAPEVTFGAVGAGDDASPGGVSAPIFGDVLERIACAYVLSLDPLPCPFSRSTVSEGSDDVNRVAQSAARRGDKSNASMSCE